MAYAREHARTVSNRLFVRRTLEETVELWDTFKLKTLKAGKDNGEHPRLKNGFGSYEMMKKIKEISAS